MGEHATVWRLETAAGTEVAGAVQVADTPWRRFIGLMGRSGLAAGEGLLLRPCSSIHMFFMRFAIDAVFCDRDLVVVGVERDLRPWRTARRKGAKVVVELPVGAAAGVDPGERLFLDTMAA